MMAVVAARELADGEVVFVGIGLPNLACNLARRTHAPRLVLIYESGAVGPPPSRPPRPGGRASELPPPPLVYHCSVPDSTPAVRSGAGASLSPRASLRPH